MKLEENLYYNKIDAVTNFSYKFVVPRIRSVLALTLVGLSLSLDIHI